MNVLVVYAHPEPNSFCGAMLKTVSDALKAQGHELKISDLYEMNFNPVEGPSHYKERKNSDYFSVQAEQNYASRQGTLPEDVKNELEKVQWADTLILVYPTWWFSCPAILKGWFDRVMLSGPVYSGYEGKLYDRGGLRGKRSLVCTSTGGMPQMYAENGINPPISDVLDGIHRGVLYFCGCTVIEPFVVFAPAMLSTDQRAAELQALKRYVADIDSHDHLRFRPLSDYDDKLVLKERLE